mmetsp:Transcript_3852/g.9095  ORF Transcript_3852/g.9095 Transcript_3852/m.9095 type:complete len:358 (+) Transcript_3852:2753-3826(+)
MSTWRKDRRKRQRPRRVSRSSSEPVCEWLCEVRISQAWASFSDLEPWQRSERPAASSSTFAPMPRCLSKAKKKAQKRELISVDTCSISFSSSAASVNRVWKSTMPPMHSLKAAKSMSPSPCGATACRKASETACGAMLNVSVRLSSCEKRPTSRSVISTLAVQGAGKSKLMTAESGELGGDPGACRGDPGEWRGEKDLEHLACLSCPDPSLHSCPARTSAAPGHFDRSNSSSHWIVSNPKRLYQAPKWSKLTVSVWSSSPSSEYRSSTVRTAQLCTESTTIFSGKSLDAEQKAKRVVRRVARSRASSACSRASLPSEESKSAKAKASLAVLFPPHKKHSATSSSSVGTAPLSARSKL